MADGVKSQLREMFLKSALRQQIWGEKIAKIWISRFCLSDFAAEQAEMKLIQRSGFCPVWSHWTMTPSHSNGNDFCRYILRADHLFYQPHILVFNHEFLLTANILHLNNEKWTNVFFIQCEHKIYPIGRKYDNSTRGYFPNVHFSIDVTFINE